LIHKNATAAKVRVLIETKNGTSSWNTVGVSPDVVEASWKALVDSISYHLLKHPREQFRITYLKENRSMIIVMKAGATQQQLNTFLIK